MPLLNEKSISQIFAAVSANNEANKLDKNFVIPIHHNLVNVSTIKVHKSLSERIPAFGLLCAILSVICWSLSTLIVKVITDLHSIQILVIRSTFQLIFYGTSIAINKYPLFGEPGHRVHLILRAISGTIAMSCVFMAYRLMPFSDASTIHFSSPVFVTVFAYFLLKEPFTTLQIITGILTLIGVTIISKPEFLFTSELVTIHEHRLEGTLLAVLASISAAFAIINLRKLKTTPAAVVVFWFAFSVIIFGSTLLAVLNSFVMPTGVWTWSLLVVIGLLGVGDQYFLTIALQNESAGPVSVVRTFNIVLSFLWEALLLTEPIEWTSVTGATIISSCVIILALVKWQTEKPEFFDNIYSHFKCGSKSDYNLNNSPQSVRSSTDSLDSITAQNTIHSNIILIDT